MTTKSDIFYCADMTFAIEREGVPVDPESKEWTEMGKNALRYLLSCLSYRIEMSDAPFLPNHLEISWIEDRLDGKLLIRLTKTDEATESKGP